MLNRWNYETREFSYKGFRAILGYEYGKAYVAIHDESQGIALIFSPSSLRELMKQAHKAVWTLNLAKQVGA
jgi:hypothetical protein